MKYYFYLTKSGELVGISDTKLDMEGVYEVVYNVETDMNNNPINVENVISDKNFLLSFLRVIRDKKIKETIWILERHLSQPSNNKTLTDAQYEMWANYWQNLRDLPNTVDLTGKKKEDIFSLFPSEPSF
jgi:hypothetical protein